MKKDLKQIVDLYLENEEMMRNTFNMDDAVCALEYSIKGEKVNVQRMKEAMKIIKGKTDTLSEFQGNTFLMSATEMAQVDHMEAYFEHVQDINELVKQGKWISNSHNIIASMVIAQYTSGDLEVAKYYLEKAMFIYTHMKDNHPWLMNNEDMGLATLLAVSGLNEEEVVAELRNSFNYLKQANIGSTKGIRALSNILSLNVGNVEKKCDKAVSIYKALEEQNKKIGSSFELSVLGGLAFVDVDSETLASEMAEVDDYLKSYGVFDSLGLGAKHRLMYAAILVMQYYSTKGMCHNCLMDDNVMPIVIATQVAMLMVMNENRMVINVTPYDRTTPTLKLKNEFVFC